MRRIIPISHETLSLPRGNKFGDYRPDFPSIIKSVKSVTVDGISLELVSHNPRFMYETRLPSPPTKTQLRAGLEILAQYIENSETLRELTYELGFPAPPDKCPECHSELVQMANRQSGSGIALCHIDYCPIPGCRQVYVSIFHVGVYDCIKQVWRKK